MNETLQSALSPLRDLPDRLASSEALGRLSDPIRSSVSEVLPAGSELNGLLAGTWLGHPLHPLLTDVVIGSWTSAVLLDWLAGPKQQKAADRLILTGLVSAAPTVLSGLNDWSTLGSAEQRVGTVHAAANAVANVLFAASYVARKRRRRMRGRLYALAGLSAASLGGFLGGDLSFRRGAGVDQTATLQGETEWTPVMDEAEATEGRPQRVQLGDLAAMVVRQNGKLYALADRCAHQGGPLSQGEIGPDCVTCPWHNSRFRLSDGAALSGPTAHPQPVLQARVSGGKIELRRAAPG